MEPWILGKKIDAGQNARVEQCRTPELRPAGGVYLMPQTVEIICHTPGATIFFTWDGQDPTPDSAEYTGKIIISKHTIIKAVAVSPDTAQSLVITANYYIGEDIVSFLEDDTFLTDDTELIDE